MDFNIDGAFAVLKGELTTLFIKVGELFTDNLEPQSEGASSKMDWMTWIFIFILLGLFLALLRQKGFIPTFDKNRTFEEEDEAEQMATFTKRLVMKDELINSELQNIEAKKSKHSVDKLQTTSMNVEGIRRRSSSFLKLLMPESDQPAWETSLFTGHDESKGISSRNSLHASTSGNKKVEVSLLLDSNSNSRKNK